MALKNILQSRLWPAAWTIFVRYYALLFLPLLGWGVDDLPGFFSHPARLAFGVIVTIQALIGAWLVYRLPRQPREERAEDLAHWQIDMYHVIFILAAFGDRRNILAWTENSSVRWGGLALYLFGAGLSAWANLTWVNHRRQQAASGLVLPARPSAGPYSFVRDPNLLSIFIYCLGFSLAFRSWAGLALMVPLGAGFLHRLKHMHRDIAKDYRL